MRFKRQIHCLALFSHFCFPMKSKENLLAEIESKSHAGFRPTPRKKMISLGKEEN